MLYWLRKLFSGPAPAGAGEQGERAAVEWLVRERGFEVIVRNWRNPRDRRDELDLVCRDREVLVFVEVKARAPTALVPGFHAIDARKKRVLRRTIQAYLRVLHEKPRTFRFDVVEVTADFAPEGASTVPPALARSSGGGATETAAIRERPRILHFENVPLFSKHFRA